QKGAPRARAHPPPRRRRPFWAVVPPKAGIPRATTECPQAEDGGHGAHRHADGAMARPASRLTRAPLPALTRGARPVLDARGFRRAQRRFVEIFPGRFHDETYVAWERDYKWEAHRLWHELLGREELEALLRRRAYVEVGRRALAVYSRPKLNLL